MEKLDFSGISTEELKYAVKQSSGVGCAQIKCENCPFNVNAICNNGSYEGRNKAFKAELNRREKDMNEMPDLKAGMIVEMDTENITCKYCVLIPTGRGLTLITKSWYWFGDLNKNKILKIYENDSNSIRVFTNDETLQDMKLLWSKKSDNDIKIEELEKTVKEALKQIEELKA